MRYCSSLLAFIALLLVSGCFTASNVFIKKSTTDEDEKQVVTETRRKTVKNVEYTFIDTLNDENEIELKESDFEKVVPAEATVHNNAAVTDPIYRVQVFASNKIETVREQKKELEKSTKEMIRIGYEAPYYKLYAGGYTRRKDALIMLNKLKKVGYLDAWIVTVKDKL